jgi:hypothetical protein
MPILPTVDPPLEMSKVTSSGAGPGASLVQNWRAASTDSAAPRSAPFTQRYSTEPSSQRLQDAGGSDMREGAYAVGPCPRSGSIDQWEAPDLQTGIAEKSDTTFQKQLLIHLHFIIQGDVAIQLPLLWIKNILGYHRRILITACLIYKTVLSMSNCKSKFCFWN